MGKLPIVVFVVLVAVSGCSSSGAKPDVTTVATSSKCAPLNAQELALHTKLEASGTDDVDASNVIVAKEDHVYDDLVAAGCTPAFVRPIALIPHVSVP